MIGTKLQPFAAASVAWSGVTMGFCCSQDSQQLRDEVPVLVFSLRWLLRFNLSGSYVC
jgi:hypothetical protein